MEYGFVYIWYDRKKRMFYIGSHWGTEDDGYICSSDRMRAAYRRRKHDFKRRIIGYNYVSRKDLFDQEGVWLQRISQAELGKRYYNLQRITKNHWACNEENRIIIGNKISKSQKLNPNHGWNNTKKKGVPLTEKHKANISRSLVGKPHTEEMKKKLSEATKGRVFTPEHRAKISNALKGKPKIKRNI